VYDPETAEIRADFNPGPVAHIDYADFHRDGLVTSSFVNNAG
jgi:hypothetical protein